VAELIAELRRLELLENTLFVFLIDNGWANGCVSKGWGGEKGGRTPIVLSWPGRAARGAVHDALVSAGDLYATILDLAGIDEGHHEGRSLRPRLEGGAYEPREALYGALYPFQSAEVQCDAARDAYGLWARTDRWKFILALKDLESRADADAAEGDREDVKVSLAPDFRRRRGEVELYDLASDPHELRNLAGDPAHAETVERLKRETLEWWRATGGGPLDAP
jgi:arylsulfatase A-like enzyme